MKIKKEKETIYNQIHSKSMTCECGRIVKNTDGHAILVKCSHCVTQDLSPNAKFVDRHDTNLIIPIE